MKYSKCQKGVNTSMRTQLNPSNVQKYFRLQIALYSTTVFILYCHYYVPENVTIETYKSLQNFKSLRFFGDFSKK